MAVLAAVTGRGGAAFNLSAMSASCSEALDLITIAPLEAIYEVGGCGVVEMVTWSGSFEIINSFLQLRMSSRARLGIALQLAGNL